MIDLHLHTTASDGRLSPQDLVREAHQAGLTTISVTDHDTTAGIAAAVAEARAHGLACIPGIEITALHQGRDVHMLAYFFDPESEELGGFLKRQREDRRRRLFEMAGALDRLGVPVDPGPLREAATPGSGRAPGRPLLAAALVRAGHVATIAEAFDKFLAEGRPAYAPRQGASPAEVIALVTRARGLTSLAHPGKLRLDSLIPELAAQGLPAIEVHHSDHTPVDTARYRELADRFELLVTGGSDYHGPGSGRSAGFGRLHLPAEEYARLVEHAGWTGDVAS
jgi:predicted metal-dependent phosphoesterase TrpH